MADIYEEIVALRARGEKAALSTVIGSEGPSPRKPGARMIVKADGSIIGSVGGGLLESRVIEKAREVIVSGHAALQRFNLTGESETAVGVCGGSIDIFIEPITPPESLFIVGAGHVGAASASLGKMLGFRTVVIDPRPDLNNPSRLQSADEIIVEDYETALKKAALDDSSYIVICTPEHACDEECLHIAVSGPSAYVGMIGSKRKVAQAKAHLLAAGIRQEALDRVRAPIGLDIGAETPEEIAVSIMAEILKVSRSRL